MRSRPGYIFPSALVSLIPLAVPMIWFYSTYEFFNPDGSPDNAPVRAIPVVILCFVVGFLFQLFAYSSLAKKVHSSQKIIAHGVAYASALSLPWSVVALYAGYLGLNPIATALKIFVVTYVYLWFSFMLGAVTQLWLITRHDKAHRNA
jgi:hypothetical protein